MAVLAPALTTTANLKEVLGIASADTSKDAALEKVIDRVTLWIEDATHRKLKARKYNNGGSTHGTTGVSDEDYIFFSGTTTDEGGDTQVDPRGDGLFYLPAWPVRANSETHSVTFVLATLSARTSGGEEWDDDLVEYEDYIVDRLNGVTRLLGRRFTPGYRNYRVTMCAGYKESALPYVPADLEGLCLELCKDVYRNGGKTLQSESIGTWSRSFATQLKNPYVEDVIARFSRPIL